MGGQNDGNALTPARANLSTILRRDCAVCANPVTFGILLSSTDDTHCGGKLKLIIRRFSYDLLLIFIAACDPACNTQLMECTGLTAADCCNVVDNNTCAESCTAPEVPDPTTFVCSGTCVACMTL